ncbi:MAG: hypothetical protein JKX70_05785 [Phycisphaerales bacterium]|nr:hypothetical protein [Phycisphaerales bacterium]
MTDRRSGPPLFDLMRERGENPNAPTPVPKPTPLTGSKPISPGVGSDAGPDVSVQQTAWDTSGGVSRAERSAAAAMLDGEVQNDSGVRLSSPMFYTLIVIAIALIVGAWTFGYQRGNKAGRDEMSQLVGDQPVVRPAGQPVVTNPVETSPQTGSQDDPIANPATSPSTNLPVRVGVMSPSGFLQDDPRERGLNYLVLATLSTEQAADAISFMYSNGVTIIGVPVVDNRSSSANNPSRYTLYSLGVAIPGNQWSAMSSARTQHQQLISSLGARWQRERRGASDFSQSKTNWEKFE